MMIQSIPWEGSKLRTPTSRRAVHRAGLRTHIAEQSSFMVISI